jgi:hypothetical protein
VSKKTLKSWAAGSGRRDIVKRAASDLARGLKDTDAGRTASAHRKNVRARRAANAGGAKSR